MHAQFPAVMPDMHLTRTDASGGSAPEGVTCTSMQLSQEIMTFLGFLVP